MFPFCRTASDQSSATWRVGPAQAVLDSCGYVEQFIYLSVHLFMYVFIYLLNLLIYLRIFSVFVYTFLYGHVCVYIHREREREICVCVCVCVGGWLGGLNSPALINPMILLTISSLCGRVRSLHSNSQCADCVAVLLNFNTLLGWLKTRPGNVKEFNVWMYWVYKICVRHVHA